LIDRLGVVRQVVTAEALSNWAYDFLFVRPGFIGRMATRGYLQISLDEFSN
jgi:hypothetical protein